MLKIGKGVGPLEFYKLRVSSIFTSFRHFS